MDEETLLDHMESRGLTEYGAHIPGEVVRDFLGIQIPVLGTKSQFDALTLKELSGVQQAREALLKQGKYLAAEGPDYRILTPAGNLLKIEAYESSAARKMRKAVTLAKATPNATQEISQALARIQIRQASVSRKFGAVV